MTSIQSVLKSGFLLALTIAASACVIAEPREGYYDHYQHRYYHEHGWRACNDQDEHCR